MAIASGLGGSFGLAAESVYGTYMPPARHHEVDKAELKKVKNTVQGGGLAAGRMVQAGARRVVVTEAAAGAVEMEVTNKTMGLLFSHIFGAVVNTIQGAGPAYKQDHSLADNIGKYLTLQEGIPDAGGVVRPYTFKGCKITSAEFSCSADGLLKLTVEFDGQKASEAETLVAVSYVAGLRTFHFGQLSVLLGTFGAEAAISGVKGFSLKIERGQKTDRFYASPANPGLKAEPLMNAHVQVSGSLDVDFVNKVDFADRFASDTPASLVFLFEGPTIATTYKETVRLGVPMAFFDGDTPTLDGPDVISGSVPFVGQFDLTNSPVTCSYITSDTAV